MPKLTANEDSLVRILIEVLAYSEGPISGFNVGLTLANRHPELAMSVHKEIERMARIGLRKKEQEAMWVLVDSLAKYPFEYVEEGGENYGEVPAMRDD